MTCAHEFDTLRPGTGIPLESSKDHRSLRNAT